jgi:hypothetical protein
MRMHIMALLLPLASAACGTTADSVCQDIGNCRSESDDQVKACQAEAKDLASEASASGCSSPYSAYFSCADDRYECNGNLPAFAGCESARAALDACLSQARAQNACGELANGLAQCPAGGPPDSATPPAPCGAAEVCTSRCYLDSVTDVCRPLPLQLTQAAQCAQQCPL